MMLSGIVGDFLVRRGLAPIRTHRTILVAGMTCSGLSTLLVTHLQGATAAALGIGMALFFIYFAGNSGWGLVQSIAPAGIVASVGTIQNFGSFVFASMAPILTGWLLDRTHSFNLTLTICCMVTIGCALSYVFIVKDPIMTGD
jgi:cyanate permease